MSSSIQYALIDHERYKYQLTAPYDHRPIDIGATRPIRTKFIELSPRSSSTPAGVLTIKEGYAWDGPSGPTIDTVTGLRASLVHDALYQLIRMKLLDKRSRKTADKLFHRILLADRMAPWRARLWYWGVRIGGWRHV
jgi:hypothetical protein